jgi:hypothetical protein
VYTYIRIHTYIYIYVYVYVYDRFEEFRETTIDESGAKTPLYPVPKGFPHNVKSRKSLEDRMLRFYAKMHASKGRVGRDRGGEEGRERVWAKVAMGRRRREVREGETEFEGRWRREASDKGPGA